MQIILFSKKMLKVTKIQVGRGDTQQKGRLTDLVNVFECFCSIHVYLYLSIHSCICGQGIQIDSAF